MAIIYKTVGFLHTGERCSGTRTRFRWRGYCSSYEKEQAGEEDVDVCVLRGTCVLSVRAASFLSFGASDLVVGSGVFFSYF